MCSILHWNVARYDAIAAWNKAFAVLSVSQVLCTRNTIGTVPA